jgi:hypothetical protein
LNSHSQSSCSVPGNFSSSVNDAFWSLMTPNTNLPTSFKMLLQDAPHFESCNCTSPNSDHSGNRHLNVISVCIVLIETAHLLQNCSGT